jgi:hypothetical protein
MKIARNRNPQLHCSKDKELFSTCPNANSNKSHPQINSLFQIMEGPLKERDQPPA